LSSIIVSVRDLMVKFGHVVALEDISLDIERGRTLLIGPNGSGKSTLLNVITGLIKPSSGKVKVLGYDPLRDNSKLNKKILYIRDKDDFPRLMKISTYVGILSSIYGKDRVIEALVQLELDKHIHKRFHELSKGLQRRVVLLEALVSNKELIIFDEPFSGLDTYSRGLICKALDMIKGSIIIASHIPPLMHFDQLILLEGGRVTYSGEYRHDISTSYFQVA